MKHTFFDQLSDSLRVELTSQLSPHMISRWGGDVENNELYKIASLDTGITDRDVSIIRQLNDFGKKFIGLSSSDVSDQSRKAVCWEKFLEANSMCGMQNDNFANLDLDVMATLELARCIIYDAFWEQAETSEFPFCWVGKSLLFPTSGFSTGPGTCTGSDGISTFTKYRGDWNVSNAEGRAILVFLRRVSKPMYDLSKFATNIRSGIKATFVPKTHTTSRLILPQLNGDLYLQYPADTLIRQILKKVGIDLEVQQFKNREAARKGSLHDNLDIYDHSLQRRAWRPCTIDLTSASDIIGLELVKYLLPPPLFAYLMACRSDEATGPDGGVVNLNMMATMGNAYCFPLQTLVFVSIVKALYYRLGIKTRDNLDGSQTFGVYGDDIIVDVTAYDYVINILRCLNMVPNRLKSFDHGFFRESCGGDYFRGTNVRPVMFENIEDDCALYSLANRLLDWGARHSVVIDNTVKLLLDKVSIRTVVPMDSGPHEGLRVPYCCLSAIPKQWKQHLDFNVILEKDFHPCGFNDVLPPSILYSRPTILDYTRNEYVLISYQLLEKVATNKTYKLRKGEISLFPFLRGGISQKKGNISQQSERIVMVVEPEYLAGVKTSSIIKRKTVETSLWDVYGDYCPTSAVYTHNVLSYYAYVLARLFRSAEL